MPGVLVTLGMLGFISGMTVGWGGSIPSSKDAIAAAFFAFVLNPVAWLLPIGFCTLPRRTKLECAWFVVSFLGSLVLAAMLIAIAIGLMTLWPAS